MRNCRIQDRRCRFGRSFSPIDEGGGGKLDFEEARVEKRVCKIREEGKEGNRGMEWKISWTMAEISPRDVRSTRRRVYSITSTLVFERNGLEKNGRENASETMKNSPRRVPSIIPNSSMDECINTVSSNVGERFEKENEEKARFRRI